MGAVGTVCYCSIVSANKGTMTGWQWGALSSIIGIIAIAAVPIAKARILADAKVGHPVGDDATLPTPPA